MKNKKYHIDINSIKNEISTINREKGFLVYFIIKERISSQILDIRCLIYFWLTDL
tara:strand:+ start:1323 stop:1487 length:165 start_codon:yes stop_codon:yes gene_type:complete